MAGNVVKSFSLHRDHDKALLARLDKLGRGELSKVVRAALNEWFMLHNGGVTLTDLYQAISKLDQKLSNGAVSIEAQGDHADDDDGDELSDDILGAF